LEHERIEEGTLQKEGSTHFTKREFCKPHDFFGDDSNLKDESDMLLKAETKMKNQVQNDDKKFWELIGDKKTTEFNFVYNSVLATNG
jgi:hypothetical protein